MKVIFKDKNEVLDLNQYITSDFYTLGYTGMIEWRSNIIVDYMRENSFAKAENNKEYMLGYAQRSVISKDEDIRATDEISFVEDLVKLKHIEILENNLN